MLNQEQNQEYTRVINLKVFLLKPANVAIYSPYIPFNDEVTSLLTHVDDFDLYAGFKNNSSKGETLTKAQLKALTAEKTSYICTLTRKYAKKNGLNSLADSVHYSYSDILHLDDADVLTTVTKIASVFTTALFSEPKFKAYEVTTADVKAATDAATKFHDQLGQAPVIIADSQVANDNINKTIDLIHANIAEMNDLVIKFKAAHIDFYNEYNVLKELTKIGVRHSGFVGTITKNGAPEKGAIVRILNTKKEAVADIDGHYSLIIVKAGLAEVEATLLDGSKQIKNFKVQKGHIGNLDFDF